MFGHFGWLGSQYPAIIGAAFTFRLTGGIINIVTARRCGTFVGSSYKASFHIPLCPFGFLELVPEVVDCIQWSSNGYLSDAVSLQEIGEAGVDISSVELPK